VCCVVLCCVYRVKKGPGVHYNTQTHNALRRNPGRFYIVYSRSRSSTHTTAQQLTDAIVYNSKRLIWRWPLDWSNKYDERSRATKKGQLTMLVAGSPCCDSSPPTIYYFLYIIDRKAQMSLDTKFMFYSHEKKVEKSRFLVISNRNQ
jgi:hypothetical protein